MADMSEDTYAVTIAQDLEDITSDMVSEFTHRDDNGNSENYKAVNYGAMDFIWINAIKEQQAMIESQQETVTN